MNYDITKCVININYVYEFKMSISICKYIIYVRDYKLSYASNCEWSYMYKLC